EPGTPGGVELDLLVTGPLHAECPPATLLITAVRVLQRVKLARGEQLAHVADLVRRLAGATYGIGTERRGVPAHAFELHVLLPPRPDERREAVRCTPPHQVLTGVEKLDLGIVSVIRVEEPLGKVASVDAMQGRIHR